MTFADLADFIDNRGAVDSGSLEVALVAPRVLASLGRAVRDAETSVLVRPEVGAEIRLDVKVTRAGRSKDGASVEFETIAVDTASGDRIGRNKFRSATWTPLRRPLPSSRKLLHGPGKHSQTSDRHGLRPPAPFCAGPATSIWAGTPSPAS